MDYPYSKVISLHEADPHLYSTIELEYPKDKEKFLDYIIPVLEKEYGLDSDLIEEKLKNVSNDKTKAIMNFLKKHNTPDPSKSVSPKRIWLKNTRSKLPEILARDILSKKEKVKFPYRYSINEDDPDMPKRGIDGFGFIFKEDSEGLALDYIVAAEVKASDDKNSPPATVHQKADSMFSALKSVVNIDLRLKKSLASAFDILDDTEFIAVVANVISIIEENDNSQLEELKKQIVVVPFLLRRREHWSEDDYGKFKTDNYEIECAAIKYYIVALDYDLVKFSDEIYEILRNGRDDTVSLGKANK
ncbi:hypothetical protein [Bacillus sp. REN3]|uniref:hypothetical protein n=1 Tax=Bacillus sp. REN3 TaxID=2802440 RepID=UPI001AED5F16|nr:hypothetical protein [Bacillus sp. REN3]